MRSFLWILMLTVIMSADEITYAIQVLNVQDKEAITTDFEKSAKAMPMLYRQKYEKGRYKVFLGEFKSHEEAISNLTLVREQVNKDAFVVRMEDEFILDPQQKMQQAIVMAQAKSLQKVEEAQSIQKESEIATAVVVPELEKKIVTVKDEMKSLPVVKDKVKTEERYCKPSKRALRESEISEALAFYSKSSYYTFRE